jgi:hypothetical protein
MLKPQYLYNIDRFGHDELAKEGASSGALLSGSSYDFFTRLRMLRYGTIISVFFFLSCDGFNTVNTHLLLANSMATSPQSPNNFASMEA